MRYRSGLLVLALGVLAGVATPPDWQARYGDAWARIAEAYASYPPVAKRQAFSTLAASRLASIASSIVRYAAEIQKPNDARYDEFRDSRLESLRFELLSPAPLHKDMEAAVLSAWLEEAAKTLGVADPFVRATLQGKSAEEAARTAIEGTSLIDVAARQSLLDDDAKAVSESTDPLIDLARHWRAAERHPRLPSRSRAWAH